MRDQPGRPAILRQMLLALWMVLAATTALAAAPDSATNLETRPEPILAQPPAGVASAQRSDELRQQLQTECQPLDKELQALELRMEAQDKRFDDQAGQLSSVITLFDVVIAVFAVLLGAASLATYVSARNKAESEARDAAKNWFDDNAAELRVQVRSLENEVQAALGRIEVSANEVAESAEEAQRKIQESLLRASTEPGSPIDLPPPSPALDDAARALQKKSPTEYSFEDWNTLAFAAYQAGDKEGAAKYWHSAVAVGGTPESIAMVLMKRGIVLDELGRAEDSVICYEDLIRRFGEATAVELQGWVAKALVNKGMALRQLKCFDEEIGSYDEVIRRFGEATVPALQKQVVMALVNKGIGQAMLECFEQAIESFDQAIGRFGDSAEPVLQENVAKALLNKGITLRHLEHRSEAIASFGQVIDRFGNSPAPELVELAALARGYKKQLQSEADE